MTVEKEYLSQVIKEDPQQLLWMKTIKLWKDGEVSYKVLMEKYPTYTINEKIQKFISRILP